jgi:peptide chain release factor 1
LRELSQDASAEDELRNLAAEDIESTQSSISTVSDRLQASLVPIHPFAHMPCLIELRPGAGGSEAALFAGDLLRMYTSYCSANRLPFSMLKFESPDGVSDLSGSDSQVQEAIIEVDAKGAYGRLRCEAGVHRVQRVPATEAKGRTHTSAASVLVLPSIPQQGQGDEEDVDDPKSDMYLDPKDVRLEVMRARGAGGQHVNKTESAVRLTYLPNGTVVSMQDSRSQSANREKAFRLLRARVAQQRREAREEEMVKVRRGVVGVAKMGRGDKIRTYNWSQNRVTDHRSGLSVLHLDDTLRGGSSLEELMESVRKWTAERELEQLVALEENNGA